MKLAKLLPHFLFIFAFKAVFGSGPINPAKSPVNSGDLPNDNNWSFIENKGQLADPSGKLLTDVKFYSHASGPGIYIRPGIISFVFSK